MKIRTACKESKTKLDCVMADVEVDITRKTDTRMTVRGIMLQGSKILVLYVPKEGLYGTPGGGVEPGETLEVALLRELWEEVGAYELDVIEYLGPISELRNGIINDGLIYNPVQNYYLVDIKEFGTPELIEYEKELDLSYTFVEIDEVISSNETLLRNSESAFTGFYQFQTELFKLIKQIYSL